MNTKIILALTIGFLSLFTSGQTVFKLDSIHQYSWDSGMMDWRFDTRDLYTYDNGGVKETNLLRLNWNGSSWENFYQFNKDYNGNNDLDQSIQQNWNPGTMTWQDGSRDSYTYNASELVSVYEYAIWTGTSWMLFNDNQYTYDGLGNRLEDVRRELDFITMMLVNSQRRTYNYTGSLLQDEIYEEWRDFLNDWENEEKTDYSYDGNNRLTLVEIRGWQSGPMDWSDPFKRTQLTYNTSDLVTEVLEQTFGSGIWNNTTRLLNTYTVGNLTETLAQEWNSGTTSWENANRQLRTFDPNDNEIELIYESWDDLASAWEGFLRLVKFWSPPETLNITIEDTPVSAIAYPNPVRSKVNIQFKEPLGENTEVKIFNIHGQQLSRFMISAGVRSEEVYLNYLRTGTYLIKLSNRDNVQVLKVVKL
ncbi:MAG: T9SS type A sorting domain-containing protein [Flavobacteriaceae bacterium]|nr:T9SS type A sorting domain-containing protein [Flavobacteriaceae bacterium]